MGTACRIAAEERSEECSRIAGLREQLWQGLAGLAGVTLNGHPTQRAPGILSVTIDGVEGESLLYALPDLAVASGSACATTSAEPSYVLRALGRSDRLAQSSLRLSLGRYTTAGDIEQAVQAIRAAVERLRAVAPPVAAA
jgi:cysteine desulfurase